MQPFRNTVVITSKFGWNIDLKTGERRPGLNSKPEHIKLVVEGMLLRLRTDRIDLLYQHRVDPEVPIEECRGRGQGPNGPRQGFALGVVRDGTEDLAARSCGAARHRRPERIFHAVARSRKRSDPDLRGAWYRLCALESSRCAVPHWLDRPEHSVRGR